MYPAQQHPPYQGPPYQGPAYQGPAYGQPPRTTTGHPVGAVLLALCVSFIVSLLYSGLILATYKDQSVTAANTLYIAHAAINALIVGALVGMVGHRNAGAHMCGAVVAALGAFFGYTNSLPLVLAESQSPAAIGDMMEADPFLPAKVWWNDEMSGGVDWFSPLGVVIAAVLAWSLAHVIGKSRTRA
ncbi:hypothetical protein [Streptomyces sp. ISL-12]|uniref:hypothetical protein n=1 Tax=Streptomyces sp. ISL-12 TaxID=2819177 RepID=UPI002035979D|nr:hypothetical protein [Streptomyces sp. ISL-12]